MFARGGAAILRPDNAHPYNAPRSVTCREMSCDRHPMERSSRPSTCSASEGARSACSTSKRPIQQNLVVPVRSYVPRFEADRDLFARSPGCSAFVWSAPMALSAGLRPVPILVPTGGVPAGTQQFVQESRVPGYGGMRTPDVHAARRSGKVSALNSSAGSLTQELRPRREIGSPTAPNR